MIVNRGLLRFIILCIILLLISGCKNNHSDDKKSHDIDDIYDDRPDDFDPRFNNCYQLGNIGVNTVLDKECYLVIGSIDIKLGESLIVLPGVRIYFEDKTKLVIKENGTLIARGSKEKPISFIGWEDKVGYWKGIKDICSKYVVLEYTIIGNGGYIDEKDPIPANLLLDKKEACNCSPYLKIRDSKIRDSAGWGIWIKENDHAIVNKDIETSNIYENNELGDVNWE